ncbi:aminopeptidase P family protein [Paracoccus fistulariae]|uniref:Aminopeptidase P family protein n=1 Tax=Paracoccus fistulariae TaxID=658446 RepID=A0ABY7SFM4_9RHOB|nr:aminopeptidase P family protein [Paracoccus fistulariae]MDB6181889.1 aminopeptidase P family protein [Paracoccus fistulariae]WCR05825.1 aminopeptidase P family protein [Paracoccus fistulariae]
MSFQDFDEEGAGGDHAARLSALRDQLRKDDLDGFFVPRADAHQGEYVAEADARLAWLTGFTGSAGFAIVTMDKAGVFIDGRYRVQVKSQIDLDHFTPEPWPETKPADWLQQALPDGGRIGFDPWLHTRREIEALDQALKDSGISLIAVDHNPVDLIWSDRPAPPVGAARIHDAEFAGESAIQKRARLAEELRKADEAAAFLSLPDSISWLLNIRGTDIARNPVVQAFAILLDDGHVTLFADPAKFDASLRDHLGDQVTILPPHALAAALTDLQGPVRLDPGSAPEAAFRILEATGTEIARGPDPVVLPKAIKNEAELRGMRDAHRRDGVAMVNLLAWLDAQDPESLTEIDVVRKLEDYRIAQGITDISFDTIMGSGPNGAIVHYRVSTRSNRRLSRDDMLLIDSGGQYPDGTTDITRTLPLGTPPEGSVAPFTAVLRGLIAISRARFPTGVAGAHIDALARQYLWSLGLDYDHGTGHGVGAALCVHEGPIRISRVSDVTLEPGMILSNEPGYYREGAFGIRLENLIVVTKAPAETGRKMLGFETLTLCPIDTRAIDKNAMSRDEIDWLNSYHARLREELLPLIDAESQDWLHRATAPLD